jgi:hypothetical protein
LRDWHGLWSAYGERHDGWPRYRVLLDTARGDLVALGASHVGLVNTIGLMQALDAWVFGVGLADRRSNADPEIRQRPGNMQATDSIAARDPLFARPVFIVNPPRSGSTLLF